MLTGATSSEDGTTSLAVTGSAAISSCVEEKGEAAAFRALLPDPDLLRRWCPTRMPFTP